MRLRSTIQVHTIQNLTSAAFTHTGCESDSKNRRSATTARANGDSLPRASYGGGRNARQSSRTHARFRMSPGNPLSRIASCHRLTAIIVRLTARAHVFGELTLPQNVSCGNGKNLRSCAEAVEDESCLWKAEEKRIKYIDAHF